MTRFLFALIISFFAVCGVAPAQEAAAPAETAPVALTDVIAARVSVTEGRARLIVDLKDVAPYAVAHLLDPMQIAVDIRADKVETEMAGPPAGEGLVSGFRIEQIAPDRARIWLVLASPVQVGETQMNAAIGDQPARLIVDFVPATNQEFIALAAKDLQNAMAATQAPEANIQSAPDETQVAAPDAANPEQEPEARRLIVIDPGHGGVDSGAESANGIKEKNIVLAFAHILQKLLVESGKFDVALTREDDRFLRLEERVNLARANKADLFISLHADYFEQEDISGTSVYIRDEMATDVLDKVLADNENRADVVAGYAPATAEDRVVTILLDLMRREMRRESYAVAQQMVTALEPNVTLRKYPVRRANFMVLQAPDMPSVLVELGFMSNAKDISNLTADAWRDKVALALVKGIEAYFATTGQ